jgi:hypothetical protein
LGNGIQGGIEAVFHKDGLHLPRNEERGCTGKPNKWSDLQPDTSRHDEAIQASLHDDHFIVGPPEQALTAVGDLALWLKDIGLDINLIKSKIYSPSVLPQGSWTRAQLSRIQIVNPLGGE